MALKDDLISVWELDEASGNAIDSHGSNDLTETGGTIAAASGPAGLNGSRDFEDSDTESFVLADNTDLSTGDIDFTISAWVNGETLSDSVTHAIAGKVTTTGNQREYYLLKSGSTNAFAFAVSATGATLVSVTDTNIGATPATATWYHIVAWHDSVNNVIAIAINDGTPDTAAHTTGVFDGTAHFCIGSINNNGLQFFDGKIAQVALWKRVLTSEERTELYAAGAGLPYSSWDAAGGGFDAAEFPYTESRQPTLASWVAVPY